jgi:hypothetical protein
LGSSIFRGKTDITLTLDGDIAIDDTGDIAKCTGFDWVTREVNKRVRTNNPSWRYHPTVGASLDYYVGLLNTEATARRIRQAIERSLNVDDIAFPGQWNVQVFPIGNDTIAIIINLVIGGVSIMLEKLIYNYTNGTSQPIEETSLEYNQLPADVVPVDKSHAPSSKYPNKYQSIIDSEVI